MSMRACAPQLVTYTMHVYHVEVVYVLFTCTEQV